jgi:hypothetical protein
MSDFDFSCVACGKPIEDGQTALELRNGPYRESRGEVHFGDSITSFLHAGSGDNDAEPSCLDRDGIAKMLDESLLIVSGINATR